MKAVTDKALTFTVGEETYCGFSLPRWAAAKMAALVEPGKPYDIEIKQHRERRSLDANARYWAMVGELTKTLNIPDEEIYKRHIREMSNYEVLCVQEEALEEFTRKWTSGHLGRYVETKESKLPGCITVKAYYGSSDFSRAEMSRLIENCIQDCKAAGVEYLSPDELARLIEGWDVT